MQSENVEGFLSSKDLTEDAMNSQFEEWWKLSQDTLKSYTAANNKVAIPAALYGFKITPTQANMEPMELQQYLTEATQRYCEAYRASLMRIGGQKGDFLSSVYSSIPTVFSNDSNYITGFLHIDGELNFVPAKAFYEIMAKYSAVEVMPEHTYVPEVSLTDHPEILAELKTYALSGAQCEPSEMLLEKEGAQLAGTSKNDAVVSADYDKILDAPLLIFLFIAAADGVIDNKELKAMAKLMENSMTGDPEHLLDIALIQCSEDTLEKVARLSQLDIGEELMALSAAIKQQLDGNTGKVYCMELMLLGHTIANSSGGGLLGKIGLKKKVGKEEQQALGALLRIFELNPEDFGGA